MSGVQNQASSSSSTVPVATGLGTQKTVKSEHAKENQPPPKTKEELEKEKLRNEELVRYLPLRAAARMGDWEKAKRIIYDDNNALTAKITIYDETALHIGIRSANALQFVTEIVKIMDKRFLEQTDCNGMTSLHFAAIVGNTEVAKILVDKNPDLPRMETFKNDTALYTAAFHGRKDMFLYLLSLTKDQIPNLFHGERGVRILKQLANARLNGIAFNLLKEYTDLAQNKELQIHILQVLSKRPFHFRSGTQLGLLQRIIYHYIPVEEEKSSLCCTKLGGDNQNIVNYQNQRPDLENQGGDSKNHPKQGLNFLPRISSAFACKLVCVGRLLYQKGMIKLWNLIKRKVPSINHIHDIKLNHVQTLKMVKIICTQVGWNHYVSVLKTPLYDAVRSGIPEMVKEILETYPLMIEFRENDHTLLQVAVLNRQDKVFNSVCEIGLHKHFSTNYDKEGNNILHLTGHSKPSTQLSGAALQMQRELQWFKCVENFVEEEMKYKKNKVGKIAREVFTESHKELLKDGEKWTKDIASSCTIVGALIVTMVFAAAFTSPGGNNDQGTPIFLSGTPFLIFWVADAVALFSSSTSVMMFLILLISRYSEDDFLKSVPNKLIIGLLTLFVSVAAMMIAFGAALHIVFSTRWSEIVIPIALMACLPLTLFGWYMFPLLAELIVSTYGKRILQSTEK